MLFQHDPAMPIGVWKDIREDSRGLFVRGRLMPEVAKAREVLALMRAGAIDGLSIGFRTVRGRTDAKSGVRRLIEVDLWEISVVTFPMLPAARVSAVKGMRGATLLLGTILHVTRMMRALSLTPRGGGLGRG
jgi:HK97 family phage prohead protease